MRTITGMLLLLVLAVGLVAADAATATVNGKVTAVDPDDGTMTVQSANPDAAGEKEMSFTINEETKIVKDGQPIQLDEVAPGDRVAVQYEEAEGARVALSIGIVRDRA